MLMTRLKLAISIAAIVLLSACSSEDAEQLTLVALGDSITYGANLENPVESAYPYLIAEAAELDVHNLAVSGWQTGQLIEAIRTDAEYRQAVEDADYIAMTIGGNDLLQILRTAEAESGGNMEVMLGSILEEMGSNVVFDQVGELIQEIRSLTDARILLFNIYNPLPPSSSLYSVGDYLLPQVNTAILNVAESYENVYLADAFAAYQNNQDAYIIAGDIHPTEEGQAILAEIGLEAFNSE